MVANRRVVIQVQVELRAKVVTQGVATVVRLRRKEVGSPILIFTLFIDDIPERVDYH